MNTAASRPSVSALAPPKFVGVSHDKLGVTDPGIVDLAGGAKAFLPPASTRQWDREPKVRLLA